MGYKIENPELPISSLLMHCYEIFKWLNDQMKHYGICYSSMIIQPFENFITMHHNNKTKYIRNPYNSLRI